MAYFKDGQVRASYSVADGLGGEGRVTGFQLDRDGTLWAATEGGLSRLKNGRAATLNSKNGLPCDTVNWAVEDDIHTFWLYTACGLVRVARTELEAWSAHPELTIKAMVFDSSDGVRSRESVGGYGPHVAKSTDGKIWFLPGDGVSVIDPHHLPYNNLPPPVHIEQITADRKTYWQNLSGEASSRSSRLPSQVRDLEIEYTACSLVAAEKVRFRVKLEGHDPDWKDVGTERRAAYNNLPPRNYRFLVKGCNNSGLWSEAGDSLEFSIDPAYYQTIWFRVSIGAVVLAMLWGLYRFRILQIAREFNAHLDGRVDERLRVARDLHDTLLQTFQAALFEFQTARNLFSKGRQEAVQTLDNAMSTAKKAIVEGRDAIQDLRREAPQSDLEHLLRAAGQEIASAQILNDNRPIFRVTVEGRQQALSAVLQDELYKIGRELLRNSFRHASASRIEAEIRYSDRLFRLRIRDDGKGMDRNVLHEGTLPGHWGLPGIRERANRIGGRLTFWTEAGAGTEVELAVPARIAYAKSHVRRRFRLFGGNGEVS
jgi:signal transduction histidine kinase